MATIATSGPEYADEKAPSWLAKVFALNPAGLNWGRGVLLFDLALVPFVVLTATGHMHYFWSALFALGWAAVADPGGSIGNRVWRLVVFGLIGAAVTALGFWIATTAWGWQVLAVAVVTLITGLIAVGAASSRARSSTSGSSSPSRWGAATPRVTSPSTPGDRWPPGRGRRCSTSRWRSPVG